jgi:hypothetical protein
MHIGELLRVPPSPPELRYRSEFEAKTIAEIGLREEHLAKLEFCRIPTGLAASAMTSKQRELLERLLDQYLGRMPEELAARERDRVAGTNQDLHFAWAGGFVSGDPHYYRIQGPQLWLSMTISIGEDATSIRCGAIPQATLAMTFWVGISHKITELGN